MTMCRFSLNIFPGRLESLWTRRNTRSFAANASCAGVCRLFMIFFLYFITLVRLNSSEDAVKVRKPLWERTSHSRRFICSFFESSSLQPWRKDFVSEATRRRKITSVCWSRTLVSSSSVPSKYSTTYFFHLKWTRLNTCATACWMTYTPNGEDSKIFHSFFFSRNMVYNISLQTMTEASVSSSQFSESLIHLDISIDVWIDHLCYFCNEL